MYHETNGRVRCRKEGNRPLVTKLQTVLRKNVSRRLIGTFTLSNFLLIERESLSCIRGSNSMGKSICRLREYFSAQQVRSYKVNIYLASVLSLILCFFFSSRNKVSSLNQSLSILLAGRAHD